MCSPRPPVRVAVARTGVGQLAATITASTNPTGPTNVLQAITFDTIRNASVQVVGVGPAQSGQRIVLTGSAQTITLQVTRSAAAQSVFVPFRVTDGCGDWRSFVGAGATAL